MVKIQFTHWTDDKGEKITRTELPGLGRDAYQHEADKLKVQLKLKKIVPHYVRR